MTNPERAAERRHHSAKGLFSAPCHDLVLAFHPDAELDGRFQATCLDSGDLLEVAGWNYDCELDKSVGASPR